MKKILVSMFLITIFTVSSIFAGGPDRRHRRRRRRGTVENVSITKVITLVPSRIRMRRRRVVYKVDTRGRRTAVFYKYSFRKDNFKAKFPNGLQGPTKVKVHVYKKIIRIRKPRIPRDSQGRPLPVQMPIGGFRHITYVSKILEILQ